MKQVRDRHNCLTSDRTYSRTGRSIDSRRRPARVASVDRAPMTPVDRAPVLPASVSPPQPLRRWSVAELIARAAAAPAPNRLTGS